MVTQLQRRSRILMNGRVAMSDSESITVKRIALDRPEGSAILEASSLDALMQHIVTRHHGYLRDELPAIERAIAKAVELRAGTKATALVSLERTFRFFKRELELHLRKEEEVLFPLIRRLEVAFSTSARLPRFPFGSITNPIGIMEEDHDTEKRQLEKMLALTGNYSGPPETATGRSRSGRNRPA